MMTGSVDEVLVVAFRADIGHRGTVHVANARSGSYLRNSGFLGVQNDLIDLALTRREFSRDWIRSRYVGAVTTVFGAYIDDHNIAGLHPPGIVVVMKDCRERAGSNN